MQPEGELSQLLSRNKSRSVVLPRFEFNSLSERELNHQHDNAHMIDVE